MELEAGENRIPIVATRNGLRSARDEIVVQSAEPQPPVQQAGDPQRADPTSPEPGAGEPEESGPARSELANVCFGGDLGACDTLWDVGPDSDEQYEAAATCGGLAPGDSSGQTGAEGGCEDYAESLRNEAE